MIELLQQKTPSIIERVRCALDDVNNCGWDSLVVNLRKPHTYRMFYQDGDYRICLHRFDECSEAEAFAHPHPWPAAFKLLKGVYVQKNGGSFDRYSDPEWFSREIMRPNTSYEITNPLSWHSIQPLTKTYTVMINGSKFTEPHSEVKTTAGKGLQSMSEREMTDHLSVFKTLLINAE